MTEGVRALAEVRSILAEFGIEVVPKNVLPKHGQTRALASLDRIRRRYGEDHARFVVMTLAETANNSTAFDETGLWATSDIVLAFKKNHPEMMADEVSRFLEFFDGVPVGILQFWLAGLDGIANKRAALAGLIWERACRVFGPRQMDLLDDRRMSAMTEDTMIRAYLQAAHDRGGSFHMAMHMMAQRIEVLEDKLERARVSFPSDRMITRKGEGGEAA